MLFRISHDMLVTLKKLYMTLYELFVARCEAHKLSVTLLVSV